MNSCLFRNSLPLAVSATALLFSLPVHAQTAPQGLPAPVVPAGFGVNIHFTSPQPDEMEKLSAVGFGVVRMDVYWEKVEKNKGIYDFSEYDKLTDLLTQKKIRPLYILCYGNPLYEGGRPPETVEGRAAYVAFAKAAATRFKGRGIMWEIWNEPNSNTFWKGGADPEKYASLAIPTARAIRAADPSSTILAPASSRLIPWKFFDTIFRRGLLKEIDAVSVHPYRMPATHPETAAEEFRDLRRLIAVHTPAGDKQVPLVCSEWGYSTYDKGISEAHQARFLARQWLSNMAEGINLSIWYDWRDDGTNIKDSESNFGTVKRDFSPKPAYFAAKNLIRDLNGFRFIHRLPKSNSSEYSLLFRKGKQVALASWNSDPKASEPDQTPQIRVVATSDADFAALSRAAALNYETEDLVAIPNRPAKLNVALTNPEMAPAVVQITVAGKTQNIKLAKSQSQSVSFDLGTNLVTTGSEALFSPQVIWNGQKLQNLPSVRLQAAYPLFVSAFPIASGLRVEISNPRSTAFTGEIRILNAGKTSTVKAQIASGGSGSFDFATNRTQPTVFAAVDSKGVTLARMGPFSFQPIPDFPTTVGASGSFNVARHAKNTPQLQVGATAVEAGADAPVGTAVAVNYEPFPDLLYHTLSPSKTVQIPANATGAVLWIHSDGNGLSLHSRFRDTTGQVFQPTLAQLTWKGWKHVSIPFYGDMWHYGGVNDGVRYGQLTWENLLLLDNSRAQTLQGSILAAEPAYVIGQSSLPGLPDL